MVLLDLDNRPVKYFSLTEIIEDFYEKRLPFYSKRKEYMLKKLEEQIKQLNQKHKFLTLILKGELEIRNQKKSEIVAQMKKYDLPDDLLNTLRIGNLTYDEIVELENDIKQKTNEKVTINGTKSEQFWLNDLNELKKII